MDVDEFQDWEMLQSSPVSDSGNQISSFEEFGADAEGVIRNDYFSVDDGDRFMKTDAVDASSEASDSLNWIEPASETRDPNEGSGEFSPESVVDSSESQFEGKGETGILDVEKIQGGENWNNLEQFKSNWGGNEFGGPKFEEFEDNKELLVGVVDKDENMGEGSEAFPKHETRGESVDEIVEVEGKKGEVVKKSVEWWRAPFDLLKYCMFRFKPVWTFSMAAALIGFAILGRRIYMVKKKARSLELKVTMDDKKVSQFMSRAARLNEAFSVVKRVPLIRPQLPAAGVAPWPAMAKLALQEA